MSQIGRNDPCPCGSGKKFKKCCALKAYTEIGPEESIRKSSIDEILKFARRWNEDEIDFAYEEFWDSFDPEEELEGPSFEIAYGNYIDWLVHDWTPDSGDEKTLIERYLDNKSKRLTPDELTVLNKMKDSVISLYEVQEVYLSEGLLLKDLLLGGTYKVKEKSATQTLSEWDILAARLLHIDGNYVLSGSAYGYPRMQKDEIMQEINEGFEDNKTFSPDTTLRDYLKENGDIFNYFWCRLIQNPWQPEVRA